MASSDHIEHIMVGYRKLLEAHTALEKQYELVKAERNALLARVLGLPLGNVEDMEEIVEDGEDEIESDEELDTSSDTGSQQQHRKKGPGRPKKGEKSTKAQVEEMWNGHFERMVVDSLCACGCKKTPFTAETMANFKRHCRNRMHVEYCNKHHIALPQNF